MQNGRSAQKVVPYLCRVLACYSQRQPKEGILLIHSKFGKNVTLKEEPIPRWHERESV